MVINLKNKIWIIFIAIIIFSIIGVFVYFNINKDNLNSNNYTSQKTAFENNSINNFNNYKNPNSNNTENQITFDEELNKNKEEIISSFSTKIYTKDSGRQNNVTLTCSKLNSTIIQNGTIFSFCDTVGPATTDKGYQKAEIFDNKGKKKQGLGGGNCQVSSTLYNAVLQIPSLVIIERHEHSNKVPYVQAGKDAAVAYGSYDLKFRNDTGYNIKIKAENTTDNVSISLIKIREL